MKTIIANGNELDSSEDMELLCTYTIEALTHLTSFNTFIDISVDNRANAIDLAMFFMSHDKELNIQTIEVGITYIRLYKRKPFGLPFRSVNILY